MRSLCGIFARFVQFRVYTFTECRAFRNAHLPRNAHPPLTAKYGKIEGFLHIFVCRCGNQRFLYNAPPPRQSKSP